MVFLAALYGVPLPVAGIGALFIAGFMVALAVAPARDAAGVPTAGLAILFGIDRIPDMFRSAVDITGYMVWAVVVKELAFRRTGPGGPKEGQEEGSGE